MKIAKIYSSDDIRIEDAPIPEIGSDEILVKTFACGICSGDVMPWYIKKKAPIVLGHEPSGIVHKVGSNVTGFNVGDKVFVHHHAPCFECDLCRRGNYTLCDTWKNSAITPGGISEFFKVPEIILKNDTIKLDSDFDLELSTLIEPLACSVKSVHRGNVTKQDIVLVTGLGTMGILNIIAAKYLGAKMVIGADMVSYRLKKGLEFGADAVINVKESEIAGEVARLTVGKKANVVIVGPGSSNAMLEGINCAAKGGRVVFFTPTEPGEKLCVDQNYLYFNEIDLVCSYSCAPCDTRLALEIITKNKDMMKKIITHRFDINAVQQAYNLTMQGKESLKAIIKF